MGCWWVDGRRGKEAGVQLAALMIRSASRKFRNREATKRSCAGERAIEFQGLCSFFLPGWQHEYVPLWEKQQAGSS